MPLLCLKFLNYSLFLSGRNSHSRTQCMRPFIIWSLSTSLISSLTPPLRSPHASSTATNRHSSFWYSLYSCSLSQACTFTSLFTWKNSTWPVRFSLGSIFWYLGKQPQYSENTMISSCLLQYHMTLLPNLHVSLTRCGVHQKYWVSHSSLQLFV